MAADLLIPAIQRVCFVMLTGERVVIIRVVRDGRLLSVEQANEGLMDGDRVEIAPVLGETKDRLRLAPATSIVKATELGKAEGWIEGPLAEGRMREKPRPGVVMRSP
jgi:hypothetical protein